DFLFGGSGPPISDVLAYRSTEQHRLLQNETDLSAKRSLAVVPDVDPVDHDAPCVGVIEARDEPHDGGLATAGRADDAYHLAGCDAEVHVAKDEVLRIVAESHVLDGDLASCAAQNARVDAFWNRAVGIEDALDPFQRHGSLSAGVGHLGEILNRLEELGQIRE